jgi:hypothetical protein
MSVPKKLTKGAQATFEFTVEQRKLAKEAKTVGSLDELEESVSRWFLKLILDLNWLYR